MSCRNRLCFNKEDSVNEHPLITCKQKEGNSTYYLFNKFKIYTKKECNIISAATEKKEYPVKISVIVPVYNVEKYLERCLNSIIHQSLKEIEIICINDGSTDNSLSILEKFAEIDKRIIILNQQHTGPSAARNEALKIAKGEYVGYVDSDDSISENFYELLYSNAKKYGADIACGEIYKLNARNNKKVLKFNNFKTYKKTEQKYKACNIPRLNYIWNKIYNREALLKSKLTFEENVVFEDIFWTHQVIHKLGMLVTVPKAKYNYFINQNSITTTDNSKSLEDYYNANKKCINYIVENRIRVKDLKGYKPAKRIRINILGIRFFDVMLWDNVKILFILGIPVLKIYINNNY